MESKRKKTSEKKYFDTIKVSEKSTNYVFGESEIDKEQFDKNFEIICQRCNGTGTDPDYKEVNVILAAIDDLSKEIKDPFRSMFNRANRNAPYCLSCYGMTKMDWVQYVSGLYKEELMELKNEMQEWFLRDVEPFLEYIHFGEVWNDGGKKVRFDRERNRWIRWPDDLVFRENIKDLKAAYKWLHRFKADGYWDFEHVGDVPFHYKELYWIDPDEHLKVLKAELILSHRVTIDRLIEIKKDLDLFWADIKALDHIEIEKNISECLPDGFKFTWENILRKFNLSLTHLPLFESNENKSKN